MKKIRVMLADDHEFMRDALGMFLEIQPDIEIVAQAVDGLDVLAQIESSNPDIICMDINMSRLNGIEATRQLLVLQPGIRVIGLSAYAARSDVEAMFRAGAVGYVVKGSAGAELLQAIHAVVQGQTYVSPELGIADLSAWLK